MTVDVSTLTQFDAITIRNCYGKQPFSEPPINTDAQKYLTGRLAERGLTLNCEVCYVLPSEYNQLLDYLDGMTRQLPGLLKASPRIDAINADKLQSFMAAKGITSSIPVSAMSKADYDKLYGYVISRGQTPECARPKTSDRTEAFAESIQVDGITEKKQLLLLQLRNQMNELLNLGIDPLHPEPILQEISNFRSTSTGTDNFISLSSVSNNTISFIFSIRLITVQSNLPLCSPKPWRGYTLYPHLLC